MNTCPHCGREPNSSKPRCANCPADIATQSEHVEHNHQVIEPEVVGSRDGSRQYEQSQWTQDGATFKTWTFKQYGSNLGATRNDSCLPGFITLGIALSLGIQFGLLASIGFLVFYAICSGIGFFVTMRRMVEGKATSPWVGRMLVWIVSAFVTIGLAS